MSDESQDEAGGATWAEDRWELCQLKYAYVRLLDTKRFTELGELLTADATSAYEGGARSQQGRQGIVDFLQSSLGDPAIVTMHTVHHPELRPVGHDCARGTWYLQDRVLVPGADLVIAGTALYEDEYRREDGRWLISHTGYRRIIEEHITWSTGAGRRLRTMFDADPASGAGTDG